MPKWLKLLYEKVFNNEPSDFFVFSEIIQHMKTNTVKQMLKWHEVYQI